MARGRFTDDEKALYMALVCRSMKDGLNELAACRMHGIDMASIRDFTEQNVEFRQMYEQAREALIDYWRMELIDIADTQQQGQIRKQKLLGDEIETRDMIDHRRLRIQTRQWLLSKLRPKQYGDKMALGGADDLPPIQSKADVTLTPEDAYKQMIGIGNGRT